MTINKPWEQLQAHAVFSPSSLKDTKKPLVGSNVSQPPFHAKIYTSSFYDLCYLEAMILEAKDKSCSSNEVLAFNLFDESWFFNNIVNGTKIMFHSSSTREDREKLQHYNLLRAPSLLTTPSLPPRPTSEVLRSSNYINHNLQQDAPLNRSSKVKEAFKYDHHLKQLYH